MGSFVTGALGVITQVLGPGTTPTGPFRPPQWQGPQLTSLSAVLPASSSVTTSDSDAAGAETSTQANTTPTTYFFDAVMRVDHVQDMRITEHPVQNGSSIVDHAYLMPARVAMEIGMSDAMARYQANQYTSAASKSVSAYQTLLYLQSLRVPITLTTRLKQYQNMEIESIRAADDNRTLHALKALVSFRQIILGTVTSAPQSARPDQTNSTPDGTVPTSALSPDLQNSFVGSMTGNFSSERGAN